MQVMPATARDPGFGIKPAKDVNDPNELGRVGNQYVGALLNKYQDPRLTMIAYNMGPARTDKWLAAGADMSKLPKETQQYIRGVNLAQGGEVKHYYAGGYEEEQYSPEGVLISGQATRTEPEKPEWEKEWDKKYLKKPKADSKKASPTEVEQFFSRYDNVPTTGNTNVDPRFSNVQGVSDESKKQDFNLIDYIREQQAERKEAAKLDKWQAGLAAGLGMLGGTSQYALENIGKGGQMGVQQLAQSQKLRAAENKAAGELYGNAAQLDLMQKTRGDALRERTRSFDEKQELARSEKLNKAIADALKANPNNVNMLNILESQVGDPSKPLSPEQLTRLDNLRKWKAITENAVRKNFATSGLSSGSSAGWSAVQKG
jgi:soluble lytic murein transglycosylase-like protein